MTQSGVTLDKDLALIEPPEGVNLGAVSCIIVLGKNHQIGSKQPIFMFFPRAAENFDNFDIIIFSCKNIVYFSIEQFYCK